MSKTEIVTLDGPAGVGKSTVARRVADNLGYAYLDTGAMYRILALHFGAGAEFWPEDEFVRRCSDFNFELRGEGARAQLVCNGRVAGREIRAEEVGTQASRLAALPVVREYLQAAQRRMGDHTPLVAEGRDMGVKVFPSARCKFFLDATAQARAQRRYNELKEKGEETDLDVLFEHICKRDQQDRSRTTDPLHPANDAVIIDTSCLSIEEVTQMILDSVKTGSFTHITQDGGLSMVDVGGKETSERVAVARARVRLNADTLSLLRKQALPKGDVLICAKLAGITAAKRAFEFIPLCHPIAISYADVRFDINDEEHEIAVEAEVRACGRTGVEMEAIVAVQIAAAALYDMCKSVQRDISIGDVRLVYKSGGRSGIFDRRGS